MIVDKLVAAAHGDGTCSHGERSDDCTTCAERTKEWDHQAARMIAARERDARTSDLARLCAEVWDCPVRVVEEMHVRSTWSDPTQPSLAVRWESRYHDGSTPGGEDIYREGVWVPSINGRDLPWQLSSRIAAKLAKERGYGK